MYVAVVYKFHPDTHPRSHKPEGDWSCFLGTSKDEATRQAQMAVRGWEGYHPDPITQKRKTYGPYEILVGELTDKVVNPIQYERVVDSVSYNNFDEIFPQAPEPSEAI